MFSEADKQQILAEPSGTKAFKNSCNLPMEVYFWD
jgi:hypothetical protein